MLRRKFASFGLAGLLALSGVACASDSATEDASEEVSDATEEASEEVSEATEEASEEMSEEMASESES